MEPASFKHNPWVVLGCREVYAAPPFVSLSVERVRLPDGRVVEDFYQLEMPDYAIVVPRLADGRILLVRQYKHGVRAVGLHPPGGHMGPGESPLAAVQRELLEETGYVAGTWRSLGAYVSNANQGCGRAHFFLADNARLVAAPLSGDFEEMEMVFLTPEELSAAIAAGEVNSLAAVGALALALAVLSDCVSDPSG
jgi:ADP-ribose pyrophosphatase